MLKELTSKAIDYEVVDITSLLEQDVRAHRGINSILTYVKTVAVHLKTSDFHVDIRTSRQLFDTSAPFWLLARISKGPRASHSSAGIIQIVGQQAGHRTNAFRRTC